MSSLQSILYILNGTISASKAGQDVEADNNVYSVNLHLFLAL